MDGKETLKGRHKYPRYVRVNRDVDISWGDPVDVFGTDSLFEHYRVDRRVFTLRRESVIGRLSVGEGEMDLTADIKHHALRLVQYDDADFMTGRILYVIYPEMLPHSVISWDHVPIEEIHSDWPEGVRFPRGSLAAEITRRDARTLAIDIEELWREHGGEPRNKFSKAGGRKLKDA
jgi:hypothetical protein